jgi:glucose/arabinose dehydrogenase
MKWKRLAVLASAAGLFFCCGRSDDRNAFADLPVAYTIQLKETVLGVQTVADSMDVPWEINWGFDQRIWTTEQGGTVSAIDPVTGIKKQLLSIPDVWRKRSTGLLGMALHPDMKSMPYVVLNYTRLQDSVPVSRLVRYEYKDDTLVNEKILLEIPGNTGHNGSRVLISIEGKVIWATGDIAKGENAQNLKSLNGKILRLNLDGSIPADNPDPGSYVYAWGFRNIQGLAFNDEGILYASEHGDATDDEVNLIRPASNYGWPLISGKINTNQEDSIYRKISIEFPLKAWTPTIAPAGIVYYNGQIPEWKHSLLLTTLKAQSLHVLKLSDDGQLILSDSIYLGSVFGRFRAICTSPNGDIYLSTSNRDWNPPNGFPLKEDDRILRIFPLTKGEIKKYRPFIVQNTQLSIERQQHPGQVIYQQYCASCHKENGKGIDGSFPALAGSQKVTGNAVDLIRLVWNGTGTEPQMPAFNFLQEDELAKVLSYIRASWGNETHDITAGAVRNAVKKK